MNEKDVFKNTLIFLDRVSVTGSQEAAYLLSCVEFFQSKLTLQEKQDPEEKPKK